MGFDEWFDKQDIENWTNKKYMLQAYEAGAESRQSEIDELRSKRETAEKNLNNAFKTIKFEQQYQEELQKRIDEAEKWIELNRKTIALEYSGYTTEEYVDADEVVNILKGEQND